MCQRVVKIGGTTSQACVSGIMKKCFSDEVKKEYTLKGQGKEKSNFSTTLFYQCLVGKFISIITFI